MSIHKYDELSSFQIDALRELGSIGAGNAASSLSGMLDQKITMSVPAVRILENNEAIKQMGGAEKILSAVLVKFSGTIEGIILYLQSLDFINLVLKNVLSETVEDYSQLNEIETSALIEIGNIMISSYINAIASMTDLGIELSVPATCINMLGGILSVPMAEYGYSADKLMIVEGKIIIDGQAVDSSLIMVPNIASLNIILNKLGVIGE